MRKLSLNKKIKKPVHIDIDNKVYYAAIFLLFGICLILWGIKYLVENMDFLSDVVKTTAVVTDINTHHGSGGRSHDIYTTTFQYEVDGEIYTDETKSIDFKPDWETGSSIEIYYNPGNPYSASAYNKQDLLRLVFLRAGLGAFLSAIGV